MNPPSHSRPSSIPKPRPCRRQPLLWAALAFAAGILAGARLWRPPLWWVVAIAVFLGAAAYFVRRRPWAAAALALGTLFLLGAFNIQMRVPESAPDSGLLQFADGRVVTLTARVLKEGTVREAGFGGLRQSLDLETEQAASEGQVFPVTSGLRLSIYGKEERAALHVFRYGERLRFSAKLHPPRSYRNPGAFDYRGYLAEKGIVALGSTKTGSVEALPGFAGSRLELWRTRLHRSVIEKVHALWPPAEAALMDAMVIGEDAFLDRGTRTNFQRSGTYHILVVSGMNVGILAFVVFWTLRRLRVSDVAASAVTVLVAVGYAFLTDVGAPIWRATLMLALYLGARLLYRERAMLNAIGAAALGLLIADPRTVFGASFQLTFLSVLIIAAIGAPLLERSSHPYYRGLRHLDSGDFDFSLPPQVVQFRLDLRLVAGRLAHFLGKRVPLPALAGLLRAGLAAYEVLLISALMQVGLALPMAYYFHRATVTGLPANLVVVPLAGVLMPAAVLAVALGYVSLTLAKVPALVAGVSLDAITGTVRWLGGSQVADVRVPTPAPAVLLAAGSALVLAMVLARRRPALAAAGLAALTASALWMAAVPPQPRLRPGVLEVTAIDVGQGDSTLLVSPQGKTLLVDAGGPLGGQRSDYDAGEEVVSPYLWWRGLSRLDAVAVSHGHADHIGGMRAVLRNFRPRELWLGPVPPAPALDELLREAQALGVQVVSRQEGDVFEFGGVTVRVLGPARDQPLAARPRNNDSLALHFSYGESSFLMEGDAEKKEEERILTQQPRADLLKVAHNGSASSTMPELLAAVHPRLAVISVGARNSFGHPRREVLARLAESGVITYRTDLNGAVTFYLDGRKVSPRLAALR